MISFVLRAGSWLAGIPIRLKLYFAIGLAIVFALLRWRRMGINAALDRVRQKEAERVKKTADRIAVARSDHPDGDDDILKRLHDHGKLRD